MAEKNPPPLDLATGREAATATMRVHALDAEEKLDNAILDALQGAPLPYAPVINVADDLRVEAATAKINAAMAGLRPKAKRLASKTSTDAYELDGEEWTRNLFDQLTQDDDRYDWEAADEVRAAVETPVLQKCESSAFHRLIEEMNAGRVMVGCVKEVRPEDRLDFGDNSQVFVVRHDWAAAFAKAENFDDGETRAPFPVCVYEFRISGMRFIAQVVDGDEVPSGAKPILVTFAETSRGWTSVAGGKFVHGHWCIDHRDAGRDKFEHLLPWWRMVVGQIRAISIVLEAEIATTEIIRAPHRLNAKRERAGKPLMYDYRVVDLAARKRYTPLPGHADAEVTHRRLHWVRGHWRHYGEHKSWIKWHLRGDPDLGFVDKEYRL